MLKIVLNILLVVSMIQSVFASEKLAFVPMSFEEISNELAFEKIEIVLTKEVIDYDGEIRSSVYDAVFDSINSHELATELADAFKEDFSTTKGIRAKCFFKFQVEQFFDNGRFVKYGNIISASIVVGHAINAKILQFDPITFESKLLPENLTLKNKLFYAPIKSSRVTSLFQLNRRHPITKRHQPHNGIDFASQAGTPVFPALSGQITSMSRTRSKGKFITIAHNNGYQTTYDHLKKFQKGLKVGMQVYLENQIGEVGRTGFSTGAHLHFGIMKDGYYLNPIYLLKDYSFQDADADLLSEETDSELED